MVEARISLDDALVLDLFAGSGALGLEAISRGASHCTFVESDSRAMACIRKNAEAFDVVDRCDFIRSDALRYVRSGGVRPFGLILADPPYELVPMTELPSLVLPLVEAAGLFVLEHDVRHDFAAHERHLVTRKYGRTLVTIFEGEESEASRAAEI